MREIDKSIQKKKQLKTTTILMTLLIAVALISSSAVTATTTTMNEKESKSAPTIQVIRDPARRATPNHVAPLNTGDWLLYHNGQSTGIGYGGPKVWEGAMRLTPTELLTYDGWAATTVRYYHYDFSSPDVVIKIYEGNTPTQPGSVVSTQPYTPSVTGWQEVPIPPVTIDNTEDLWVSIEMSQTVAGYPLGADSGPAIDEKGDWLYDGSSWYEIQTIPLDYNWCIEVLVEGDLPAHDVGATGIISPNMYSAMCPCVPVEVSVKNYGTEAETNVPVNVQIRRNVICEDFDAPPAPPTTFFMENFEGPWVPSMSGPLAPIGWDNLDYNWDGFGWMQFPYGLWFNDPVNPDPVMFAACDSDAFIMPCWDGLVTPAIPTPVLAPGDMCVLDFEHASLNWAPDQIEVRIYSASTGTPYLGMWSPFVASFPIIDPPYFPVTYGHLQFDITPFISAAGDTVWIEFFYDTLGGGWDGCFNIDLVTLGTVGAAFPPVGWTEQSVSGSADWDAANAETADPYEAVPLSNGVMAEFNSGMGGTGSSRIYTTVTLDPYCNPHISFWMWHDTYGSADEIQVQVNDGGGWTDVGPTFTRLCCPDCPIGWFEHVVDLSAYSGTVDVGLLGICDTNTGAYNLHIEDICIFYMEYDQTKYVDLDSGQELDVEFPEWCPCQWQMIFNTPQDFDVVVTTELDTDEAPYNDEVRDTVTIYFPYEHDVGAISIDKPVGIQPIQTFEMCATIKNFGQYEECCFTTYMQVEEGTKVPGTVTLLSEGFEGAFEPAGWTQIVHSGTGTWQQENYGADSHQPPGMGMYYAEADGYEAGAVAFDVGLVTPPLNMQGLDTIDLAFARNFQDFAGNGDFEVRTYSGSTLTKRGYEETLLSITTDDPGGGVYTMLQFDPSGYMDPSAVFIEFWYGCTSSTSWSANIDDVVVSSPYTWSWGPVVYTDEYCVESIDICEELPICFDDWTPQPPLDPCGEVTYRISAWTNMCDPMDDNGANDYVEEFMTVQFFHDVSVKQFTSPAIIGRDTWYAYNAYDPSYTMPEGPVSFDSATPGAMTLLQASVTDFIAGACWVEGEGWYGSEFYGDLYHIDETNGDMTSIGPLAYNLNGLAYDDVTDTMYGATSTDLYIVNRLDGTTTHVGPFNAGFTMIGIACDGQGKMYGVTVDWTADSDLYEINMGTGQATSLGGTGLQLLFAQDLAFDKNTALAPGLYLAAYFGDGTAPGLYSIALDGTPTHIGDFPNAMEISGFAIPYVGGPQVPTPEIFIPCGTQDICVEFENLGTFDEPTCTVTWELFEYISDPPNPVSVDSGSFAISLDSGEVKEECFSTYNFQDPGVYEIVVSIIDDAGVDCYPENNAASLVLGVDCCPPESEYTLNPATPDGENNWYVSDVKVTITAVDPPCPDPCILGVISGVAEIKYEINGVPGSIPGSSGFFMVEDDGNNLVEFWAVDNVGNEEVHQIFTIAIDQTPPTCDLAHTEYEGTSGWMVDFEAIAADVTSGMNRVEFKRGSELLDTVTAPPYEYTHTWESGDGSATFYAYAYDQAGNSASDSASIQLSLNLVLSQGKVVSTNQVTQRLI
jgi:hypothetical protein